MDYTTIFDMPEPQVLLLTLLQTLVVYLLVLVGLKLAGRRMFAEMGAQDLVVLLLIADAANLGLTHNDGGFWSSIVSIIAIVVMGTFIERIPVLRHLVEGKPITLYADGQLRRRNMEENHVEISDLEEAARNYGLGSFRDFTRIVLEPDGEITGTVRRPMCRKAV